MSDRDRTSFPFPPAFFLLLLSPISSRVAVETGRQIWGSCQLLLYCVNKFLYIETTVKLLNFSNHMTVSQGNVSAWKGKACTRAWNTHVYIRTLIDTIDTQIHFQCLQRHPPFL